MREAARTLSARREHGTGDGNFPDPEPERRVAEERPRDRIPRDVPKDRHPRSAPKLMGSPLGQRQRNAGLEMRDEHRASPRAASGIERAQQAAAQPARRPKPAKRPTARRSSAAKREAMRRAVKRTASR